MRDAMLRILRRLLPRHVQRQYCSESSPFRAGSVQVFFETLTQILRAPYEDEVVFLILLRISHYLKTKMRNLQSNFCRFILPHLVCAETQIW